MTEFCFLVFFIWICHIMLTHLIILRTITTTTIIIIIIIILLLWLLQLLMLPQPPFKPAYYTLVIIDLCKVLSSRLNIADFFSQSLRDCFSLQFYKDFNQFHLMFGADCFLILWLCNRLFLELFLQLLLEQFALSLKRLLIWIWSAEQDWSFASHTICMFQLSAISISGFIPLLRQHAAVHIIMFCVYLVFLPFPSLIVSTLKKVMSKLPLNLFAKVAIVKWFNLWSDRQYS